MVSVIHNLDRVTTYEHLNCLSFPKHFQPAEFTV